MPVSWALARGLRCAWVKWAFGVFLEGAAASALCGAPAGAAPNCCCVAGFFDRNPRRSCQLEYHRLTRLTARKAREIARTLHRRTARACWT